MTSPTIQRQACVRIELPWPDKRLNPNARPNRYELARVKSGARTTGRIMAKVAKPPRFAPDSALRVTTTFFPPDRRARDEDNLKASMKAIYDGIADGIASISTTTRPPLTGSPITTGWWRNHLSSTPMPSAIPS